MNMIGRIAYFISTTVKGIKGNLYLNAVTVITIAVAFLILNIFFVISGNVSSMLGVWKGKIKVVAYLKDGLSGQQLTAIENQIKASKDINSVQYFSQQDALNEFRKELKGQSSILSGVSQDVLPAYLLISVKDRVIAGKAIGKVASFLKGISGISDVQYGEGIAEKISGLLMLVKMLGIGIGGFMLFAIFIIVSNTIRISIFSRKDEIEILKLVGATNSFIEIPFILEGVLQVVAGAALSLVLLYFVYLVFLYELHQSLGTLFVNTTLSFISKETMIAVLAGSALLGFAGSFASVGRFIRQSS